jgi:hypothetical protein
MYVDMMSSVLGEVVELAVLVVHGMVPLFQVKELIQLVA